MKYRDIQTFIVLFAGILLVYYGGYVTGRQDERDQQPPFKWSTPEEMMAWRTNLTFVTNNAPSR